MEEIMYRLFKFKRAIFVEGINFEADVIRYNELYDKIIKLLYRIVLIICCFFFGYFVENGFTFKLNLNILDWLVYIVEGVLIYVLIRFISVINKLIGILIPTSIITILLSFMFAVNIYTKVLVIIGNIGNIGILKPLTAIPIPGLTENLLVLIVFDLPVVIYIVYLISSLKKYLKNIKPLKEIVHLGITDEHRTEWETQWDKQDEPDEEYGDDYEEYSQQESTSINTNFDFFKGCKSLEDVKIKYKKLSSIYHPDTGYGDTEIMKQINVQYEEELKRYKESHEMI